MFLSTDIKHVKKLNENTSFKFLNHKHGVFIECVNMFDVGCQKPGVFIDVFLSLFVFQLNEQFRLGYNGLFGVFVEL
jgi:hypothetical protein